MNKLKEFYEKEIDKVGKSLVDFPWEDKRSYINWLAQTYYFVKASTRLLCLVAATVGDDLQSFHNRFIDHANEEKSHERIIIKDLSSFGERLVDFEPLPVTQAFYQSQYYWITQGHPLSFFGYILVLEGIAAKFGPQIHPQVSALYGEKSTSFVRVHAQEDQDHIVSAFEALGGLDEAIQLKIIENFKFSSNLYQLMLEQVIALDKKKTYSKSA